MKIFDTPTTTPPVPCILAAVLPAVLVSHSGRQRLKNGAPRIKQKAPSPHTPFSN